MMTKLFFPYLVLIYIFKLSFWCGKFNQSYAKKGNPFMQDIHGL